MAPFRPDPTTAREAALAALLAASVMSPALAAEIPQDAVGSHVVGPRVIGPHVIGDEAAGSGGNELQPYQLLRSLERVQDRLASGDHASQPMQRTLIKMLDASFASRESAHFENELNRRALVVYAMSGGNPATVEASLPNLGKDDPNRTLAEKVLFYTRGEPAKAMDAFAPVDPMAYSADVGMYVALIKGSLIADAEPANALALLDRARLLGPGTLVEEAALRRSLDVANRLGDAPRFLRLSEQYVRSYLRSPYASQFADTFVAGVVALQEKVERQGIVATVALMDPDQQMVIYLRIARRAAIDGLVELAAFAATQAEGLADDPRAELYVSLSSVTSANVGEVLDKLQDIDRASLSANDRQLLDAAHAIAAGLTVEPDGMNVSPPAPGLPTADAAPATAASGQSETATERNRAMASQKAVDTSVEMAEATVASTRARLAEIDKLIGEMPE